MIRVQSWEKKHRWEAYIDPGMDLAKNNIEDMVNLRPKPGVGIAIHQSAEKGFSMLMCRPQTAAQSKKLSKRVTARELAKGLRTETELYDEANEGPRPPARNYYELRDNVVSFTGGAAMAYGETSNYYKKLYQLCEILLQQRVIKLKGDFSTLFC